MKIHLWLTILTMSLFVYAASAQTFNQSISKSLPIHGGNGVYVTAIRQTNTETIVSFEIQNLARRDKKGKIKKNSTDFSINKHFYLMPVDMIPNDFVTGIIPWNNNSNNVRSTLSLFQATGIQGIEFNQSYYCAGGTFQVSFNNQESRIQYGKSKVYLVELVDWYSNGMFVGYRLGYKWQINLDIPYPNVGNINKSESMIKDWIIANNNGLYGIYKGTNTENSHAYKLAFVKDVLYGDVLVYLGSDTYLSHWKVGDIKAKLEPTATKGFYAAKWRMADKSESTGWFVSFSDGSMTTTSPIVGKETYIKMFPSEDVSSKSKVGKWSGTGFALKDGYIVTNHHVVEGSKTIKVYGVNGNPSRSYTAEIVALDKNNDLAIIKINDYSFNGFATIPYSIKTNMAEVGENIFVLGYPLAQLMGNEIKLTNGIISSRSGYQGDISTYQMSAPVQPGNSGGPMFDDKGNVIGIVNAGIPGAENVGYAIKTSYLKNLVENVTSNNILPNNNQIESMSLPQKVAKVRDFVFFIMCE